MRKSKYTKELLEPIVKDSYSVAEVLNKLNLKLSGGNYRNIQFKFRYLKIDTKHFKGQAWNKGLTSETDERVRKFTKSNSYSNEEIFVENSPIEGQGNKLTKRLIKLGWIYECKKCELLEWLGEKLKLHLDHTNGINNDNRFENLRWLCPNCHSQTKTYCRKKFKNASVA